jgi:hypothetical protein
MREPVISLECTKVSACVILLLAASGTSPAHADEPLGAYVGVAVGRGVVKADLPVLPLNPPVAFDESRTAFSAVLGIRPLRHLGAEIGYVDFGRNSETFYNDGVHGTLSLKADTAFAVLYLPLSSVDFYGKVGLARLQSSASAMENYQLAANVAAVPACISQPCPVTASKPNQYMYDQTSTNFAVGAGMQVKVASWGSLGSLAVRFEYERFNFAGENPFFASLGANWTFLR